MSATTQRKPLGGAPGALELPNHGCAPGVTRAARRVAWAQGALVLLALAAFGVVLLRLFERWRVTSGGASHEVSILGQRLNYPTANLAALLVLGLALVGIVLVALAIWTALGEIRAARRLAGRLAGSRPLAGTGAFLIDQDRPEAFCAGLGRPRVYITTGALAVLDPDGLEAVLAHERHHARRRDPLRLATGRVLARAMFFLPAVAALARQREMLAEIRADEAALRGDAAGRPALARAMLAFSEDPAGGQVRVDPARVDHLLGEPPSWRFPMLVFIGAALLLGLLGATAVLVGQEAVGAASLAPPFLSSRPCIVVLALLPGGLALAALALGRRRPGGCAGEGPMSER